MRWPLSQSSPGTSVEDGLFIVRLVHRCRVRRSVYHLLGPVLIFRPAITAARRTRGGNVRGPWKTCRLSELFYPKSEVVRDGNRSAASAPKSAEDADGGSRLSSPSLVQGDSAAYSDQFLPPQIIHY